MKPGEPAWSPADLRDAAQRIRRVASFDELAAAPWADGVNALCWERTVSGDFAEVVARLGAGEGIVTLEEERLGALALSAAGRTAVAVMIEDLRRLRELERDPVLNCIYGYPRDEAAGAVATDVFSFHADSAPVPTDTWLCTYHGAPSEGLANGDAQRKIDLPETRAALRREFGGPEGAEFEAWLAGNCYDLHYAPRPGARPYVFGVGNLWRIACEWPGCPVPPCVHRAPGVGPGDPPRLLLIS